MRMETSPSSSPDAKDKLSSYMKYLTGNLPDTKLESMGLGMMRMMFGSMWGVGLVSATGSALLGILFTNSPSLDPDSDIALFDHGTLTTVVYTLEGLLRTLGAAGLMFLLCTFPQRVIRSAMENHKPVRANQLLLSVELVLLAFCPMVFFYGVVLFWLDFPFLDDKLELGSFVNSSQNFANQSFFLTLPSLMHVFESTSGFGWSLNIFLVSCYLVTIFVFPSYFFKNVRKEEPRSPPVAANDDDIRGEDDDIRGEDDEGMEQMGQDVDFKIKAKTKLLGLLRRFQFSCSDWGFAFVILLYFCVLLICGYGLKINVSFIPFVHLITVIRLCAADVNLFVPFNSSVVFEDPVEFDDVIFPPNTTLTFVFHSFDLTSDFPLCSPSQVDAVLFLRVLMLTVCFLIECWLLFYLLRGGRQTKMFLRGVNYFLYRGEILEFQFFRTLLLLASSFVMLIGILSASLNPFDLYSVTRIELRFEYDTQELLTVTFDVYQSPLFQVGVTFGTVGFGSVTVMMVVFLLWMCYVSLPVDSFGFKGWCCGRKLREDEEKNLVTLYSAQSDYLAVVPEEDMVVELMKFQKREEKFLPPVLRFGLASAFSSRQVVPRGALEVQIAGNFLCLETEILLFHFMHLSYMLANAKTVGTRKEALTWEEKCALVEDERFTLEEHIVDEETDTHAYIFSSFDRVVVAFRGSVSVTNWRTDFDFAEVECRLAVQVVAPDYTVLGEGNPVRAKRVAEGTSPVVHRGFVLAYDSVRDRVLESVSRLRQEAPFRVVFVTGHSLGGGLSILCTLDLAVTLHVPPTALSLTTWGCPKIGSFAFVTRVFRVCPSARRFAMVDDIITKMPPKRAFANLTLSGWFHVGTEILLNNVGQCLIRPTDLERFIFQRTLGNASAHRRMNYATSIMIWLVRSQPEFHPDWWISVLTLFQNNRDTRLRQVPTNIRNVLTETMNRPGVVYKIREKMVRDMMVSTAEEEEEVGVMITQLLMAFRTGNGSQFDETFERLQELKQKRKIFKPKKEEEEFFDAVECGRQEDLGIV